MKTTKTCTKCLVEKKLSDFNKHPQTKDGLQCRCRDCQKDEKKQYYKKNKINISETNKTYRKEHREKLIEYSKIYYKKNRIKLLEEKKEYYKKNQKIIYEKLLIYNEKNRERVSEYKKLYHKKLKESSPLYKLKVLMRDRLNKFFKYSKLNKNNSTLKIVGCPPDKLKEHIEKQFVDGMSWENHGLFGWHIDHIIPLSSAKTEEELYKLCHFSNLQPLWAKDNLRKSNKADYL